MLREGILTSFGMKGKPTPRTIALYFQSKGKIYELPPLIQNMGMVGERRQFKVIEEMRSPLYSPHRRPIPISGVVELG